MSQPRISFFQVDLREGKSGEKGLRVFVRQAEVMNHDIKKGLETEGLIH